MKLCNFLSALTVFILGFVSSSDPLVPLIEISSSVHSDITKIMFSFIYEELLKKPLCQEQEEAYREAFRRFRTEEITNSFSSYEASIEFFAVEFLDIITYKNVGLREVLLIIGPKRPFRDFITSLGHQKTLLNKIIIDRFLEAETLCSQKCKEIGINICAASFLKANFNKETFIVTLVGKRIGNFTLKVLVGALKKLNTISLNLTNNMITDISPLASLSNLRTLDLSYNQISELSSLASLSNLRTLDLKNNRIADISPLAPLSSLLWLNLSENQIDLISSLASFLSLLHLDLSNNKIADISALASLSVILQLYLNNNQIVDISALAPLSSLETLELKNNQIVNISALASLIYLIKLNLNDNQIIEVSKLGVLSHLPYLHLSNSQIKSSN